MADKKSDTFRLADLPIELREKIWKLAIFPRVISTGVPCPERGSRRFAAPVLAHVCHESRRVAMRTGRMYQMRHPATGRTQWTWFDTEHDTLFVSGKAALREWLKKYKPGFVRAIQHVFVGINTDPILNRTHRPSSFLLYHNLRYRKHLDSTVSYLLPNLKTMFFYDLGKQVETQRIVTGPSGLRISYRPRRRPQNQDQDLQGLSSQYPPLDNHKGLVNCDKLDIANMPHFDGPFELDPSKPHEARWIEKSIARRGGIDAYHTRVASYIDYMLKWKKNIHMYKRGEWIMAEWSRTPVAMAQAELALLASPVSIGAGVDRSSKGKGGDADEDEDEEDAIVAIHGYQGHYLVNTENPWVKACLARMPEMRFVFTL